jgi:hypothetical protein
VGRASEFNVRAKSDPHNQLAFGETGDAVILDHNLGILPNKRA